MIIFLLIIISTSEYLPSDVWLLLTCVCVHIVKISRTIDDWTLTATRDSCSNFQRAHTVEALFILHNQTQYYILTFLTCVQFSVLHCLLMLELWSNDQGVIIKSTICTSDLVLRLDRYGAIYQFTNLPIYLAFVWDYGRLFIRAGFSTNRVSLEDSNSHTQSAWGQLDTDAGTWWFRPDQRNRGKYPTAMPPKKKLLLLSQTLRTFILCKTPNLVICNVISAAASANIAGRVEFSRETLIIRVTF